MARTKSDPIAEALGSVDLFAGLAPKELSVLAGLARPYSYSPGDDIVVEGDTSARFYLITSGTVDVLIDGKRVNKLGPGESFGEIAVLDRGPRTATVRATSPVETLSLASFSLRPVLKEHPDILMKLVVHLCERLRAVEASATH
jgi:CRP/FNR family transcriptional regulator, cyclic AMP receptor protein